MGDNRGSADRYAYRHCHGVANIDAAIDLLRVRLGVSKMWAACQWHLWAGLDPACRCCLRRCDWAVCANVDADQHPDGYCNKDSDGDSDTHHPGANEHDYADPDDYRNDDCDTHRDTDANCDVDANRD